MIIKRGERAGQQVVHEANERAAREERWVREMQAQKERETQLQMESRAAARAKMLEEVHASRKKQIEIKEKLKVQSAAESSKHVKEVRMITQCCSRPGRTSGPLCSCYVISCSACKTCHKSSRLPLDTAGSAEGRTVEPQ
jgi:hypothetical protein